MRADINSSLSLKGEFFKQSFNRPNLRYEVRAKSKKCCADIAVLIKTHYPRASGIVYCLSKRNCEETAAELV